MAQMTPAEQRAAAEAKLAPLGKKRIRLQQQLDDLDAEMEPFVTEALRVEVSERRINELTGWARATIRKRKPQ